MEGYDLVSLLSLQYYQGAHAEEMGKYGELVSHGIVKREAKNREGWERERGRGYQV